MLQSIVVAGPFSTIFIFLPIHTEFSKCSANRVLGWLKLIVNSVLMVSTYVCQFESLSEIDFDICFIGTEAFCAGVLFSFSRVEHATKNMININIGEYLNWVQKIIIR